MSLNIKAVEHYLPSKVLSNQELVEQFDFDVDFMESKLGVCQRRRAGDEEGCHAMAHQAAASLLEREGVDPEAIELLILVTQNPDYKLPHVSALLQNSLGLPSSLCALDVNLGCSGFVYALSVAKGLMETNGFKQGLIVTSDPYSKVLWKHDRTTVPLFGDAAAAVLVESDPQAEGVGAFVFGTDGSGAESLIVRTGGSRHPQKAGEVAQDCLQMAGRAIFNFVMRTVPPVLKQCVERNGYGMEQVDHFVLHQAGRYVLENLGKRIQASPAKMVYALEECGNTVSSSIPIALQKVLSQEENRGGLALLCGFGVGLSWAATTLRLPG